MKPAEAKGERKLVTAENKSAEIEVQVPLGL